MSSFTLQKNAQVPLTANVIDQLGSPAHAASAVSWTVADEAIASLDHASGDIVNLIAHEDGSTAVTLTVGALTTILHVTVAATVPSAVSIDIGAPVAKPQPTVEIAAHTEAVEHVEPAAPAEAGEQVEAIAPAETARLAETADSVVVPEVAVEAAAAPTDGPAAPATEHPSEGSQASAAA